MTELDDKKEKYQSCECWIEEEITQMYVVGYGPTDADARVECLQGLDAFIEELLKQREKLIYPRPCDDCIYDYPRDACMCKGRENYLATKDFGGKTWETK